MNDNIIYTSYTWNINPYNVSLENLNGITIKDDENKISYCFMIMNLNTVDNSYIGTSYGLYWVNKDSKAFLVNNNAIYEKHEDDQTHNISYVHKEFSSLYPIKLPIVDNLTTDAIDKALSARQGKEIKTLLDNLNLAAEAVGEYHEYKFEDFDLGPDGYNQDVGKYYYGIFWKLSGLYVGMKAPSQPTFYWGLNENTNNKKYFGCLKIPVKVGQRITLSTKGKTNARSYALTDENNILYEIDLASTDYTTTPKVLFPSKDGYLYVNCSGVENSSMWNKIYVIVESSFISKIDMLCNQLDAFINSDSLSSNSAPNYKNNPFPISNTSLKILALGNSYTDNMLEYIKEMCKCAGILSDDIKNTLCIYRTYQGSASLQTWYDHYNDSSFTLPHDNPTASCVRVIDNYENNIIDISQSHSIKDILSHDWDIIILQQVSTDAVNYTSFNNPTPYLTKLISYIRENCTNQKVTIAWNNIWSYKSNYVLNNVDYGDSVTRWDSICKATKNMMQIDGIDIIIPTGTAIQNAREYHKLNHDFNAGNVDTENNFGEFTRDGTHLQNGLGKYLAACVFFQTILAPIFNKSVLGNTYIPNVDNTTGNDYGAVGGTAEDILTCQKLALAATVDMWHTTTSI